jgi:hypothetical protein
MMRSFSGAAHTLCLLTNASVAKSSEEQAALGSFELSVLFRPSLLAHNCNNAEQDDIYRHEAEGET